jgi:L-seryl-tRNA(Ser) seleniumtransferase
VTAIEGITTSMVQPAGLSNRTPSLRVMWPRQQFGVTGEELARTLFTTEPRIAMVAAGGAGDPSLTGVSITPYMLSPGDEKIVADRLHALLSGRSRGMRRDRARRDSPLGSKTASAVINLCSTCGSGA